MWLACCGTVRINAEDYGVVHRRAGEIYEAPRSAGTPTTTISDTARNRRLRERRCLGRTVRTQRVGRGSWEGERPKDHGGWHKST